MSTLLQVANPTNYVCENGAGFREIQIGVALLWFDRIAHVKLFEVQFHNANVIDWNFIIISYFIFYRSLFIKVQNNTQSVDIYV